MVEECLPEAGAGVDDPVSDLLLPDPLLHEGLLAAKQLHGQLVVCRGKDVLELVPHPVWLGLTGHRVSGDVHHVQGDIVHQFKQFVQTLPELNHDHFYTSYMLEKLEAVIFLNTHQCPFIDVL